MGILSKLQTNGSNLTDLDGKTPSKYPGTSQYQKDLAVSQLDLDGKTPTKYDQVSKYQQMLSKSQLDLDGKTPAKYNQISQYQKDLAVSQLDLNGKTPIKYTDNLPKYWDYLIYLPILKTLSFIMEVRVILAMGQFLI